MICQFPSYLEHQGAYNVNIEDLRNEEEFPLTEDEIVRSVKELPPLTWKEFEDIRSATYRALVKYGRLPGTNEKEAEAFYRYCVGDELLDRTVRVELPNFSILSPQFVEQLQREVLATRPLWRIFIVAESPDTVVIIYPKIVRLGTVPPNGDWKTALADIVSKVLQIREMRTGPQRRQKEYLRSKIKKLVSQMQAANDSRPLLVAAFDTYYLGTKGELSIWLLYPTKGEYFDITIYDPEEAAVGEQVAVKMDGTIDEYYEFHPDRQPAFWLSQWVLPGNFEGEKLALKKIRPGNVVESRWTIDFDRTSIIKDKELKSLIGSSNH